MLRDKRRWLQVPNETSCDPSETLVSLSKRNPRREPVTFNCNENAVFGVAFHPSKLFLTHVSRRHIRGVVISSSTLLS